MSHPGRCYSIVRIEHDDHFHVRRIGMCHGEQGYPPEVPEGARVAWMATEEEVYCDEADLVFLDRPLWKLELPLANVCPTETAAGKLRGTTCATCRKCWTD